MKLIELEIHNVRGIKDLNLKQQGRNFVIYGPNGSGKSAVVDAIDFLLTGQISRLTGEGTGGITLKEHGPHIEHQADEAIVRGKIKLHGLEEPVEIMRCMKSPSKLKYDDNIKHYLEPVIQLAKRGQYVLTRKEILKYITAPPKNRAEAIQTLLNIQEIENIRKKLVKIRNKFEKDLKTAKKYLDTSKVDLKQLQNWNIGRNELKRYFKSHGKTINVSFKNNQEFVIGHYIESLYAFERSIFWFFNYKHNLDPFNQVASEQAVYYSEFFSVVAITRFLGGSLNHTPLGLFKLNIDWKNNLINTYHHPTSRSSHGSYKDLLIELFDRFDFSDYLAFKALKLVPLFREKGFLTFENRKENVYDLSSRMSDPFKHALHRDLNESSIKATRSWNFLRGLNTPYPEMRYNDSNADFADYVANLYYDDGYKQHHIGDYWKFIIFALKRLDGTEDYIKNLIWKINRFDECDSVELDKSTKDILISWLST